MEKLKLNLDQLQVESFEVARRDALRGTVRGAAPDEQEVPPCTDYISGCGTGGSGYIGCISNSECVSPTACNSCWDTCPASCGYTCPATCAPAGQMCA